MKKINKEFEEKCIKLKNRIQRLKTEEEDCRKKLVNYRKREEQDKQIKNDKEKLRMELQKKKEEKNRALNNKKNLIQEKKQNDKKARIERRNANLSVKKTNYKNYLTDKYLMKIIKEQLANQQKNKNAYSHAKIRQEYNEYETNKMKKNIEKENLIKKQHEDNIKQLKDLEKEMRKTCNKLEVIEKQYLDKLNQTKYMSMKVMEDNKSFNYSSKIKKNRANLFVNKSMEDMNRNGISKDNNINEDEKDYKNRNRSVLVNRNFSPSSKSQRNMIKFVKPKSKGKHENYISINYYPKSNRSKNSKGLILNNNNSVISNNKGKDKEKDKDKENKKIKKNLFKNNNKNVNK